MSTTSIQNTAKKGIRGVNKCVDLTKNDPHGRDVCIGSNMGEMYVLVHTWERCMYWFKHGRDVCIGSNMGEMYVLVQT